ncbi:hypothetical protein [Novosphingobium aquimarinum]|uniref:hypothetical protein n=1 Tax=Novosphingobium aquimarinum TaxID=2682494 RepID=UPI0012ECA324|nr:hypothetical protein [Novosphingobium aquimarinum]
MSEKINPAEQQPTDKNPAHQTSEAHGSVKGQQVTDHNTKKKDMPTGNEHETRGQTGNR